jgi:FKBP-type peptidyl-prolyl cis-trans isomerase (trigger factor)
METVYDKLKKLEEKHSEAEYQAEVPLEALEVHISKALAQAGRDFIVPGFRKGKAPEHIVRERVDEMELLETAADEALRAAVRKIITDENLSIVGSPQLTITKIAPKNPLAFKVRFALYPAVKLPDYKKIGSEIAERAIKVEVTEAEMNESIARLLNMLGMQKTPGTETDTTDPATTPQLTDDIVKQFGPFENVDAFKAKLKENMAQEKELKAKEGKREEIMRAVVEQSKVELPPLLINEEWYAFEERRNAQLEEAKLSLEDYLKQSNKTEKELEKDERGLITERLKTTLVFREIQKAENIAPSEKEIQTNIAQLKLSYPDRGEAWLRETSEALLVQEKIFALLGLPIGNPLA